MPKVTLKEQYLWSGVSYGPGEIEVPQSFIDAYPQLKPPEEKVLPGEPNLGGEEAESAVLGFPQEEQLSKTEEPPEPPPPSSKRKTLQ